MQLANGAELSVGELVTALAGLDRETFAAVVGVAMETRRDSIDREIAKADQGDDSIDVDGLLDERAGWESLTVSE